KQPGLGKHEWLEGQRKHREQTGEEAD
ncbi:DNA-directed RNA polymerase, partial [Halorubrum sp. SD626R]